MAKISARQAGEQMGVSASMVYQLCAARRIAHVRLGGAGRRGKILIDEADVEAFVAAARVEAQAAPGPAQRATAGDAGHPGDPGRPDAARGGEGVRPGGQ